MNDILLARYIKENSSEFVRFFLVFRKDFFMALKVENESKFSLAQSTMKVEIKRKGIYNP